jgi:hypothetical protein
MTAGSPGWVSIAHCALQCDASNLLLSPLCFCLYWLASTFGEMHVGDVTRRRVVGFVKSKNKRKPPFKSKQEKPDPNEEMVGMDEPSVMAPADRAHAVVYAASRAAKLPPPKPPGLSWQQWLARSLSAFTFVLALWFGYDFFEVSRWFDSAPSPQARPTLDGLNSPRRNYTGSANAGVSVGGSGSAPASPVAPGSRTSPTDESFIATFNAQRKHGEIDAKGECTVTATAGAGGLQGLEGCLKHVDDKAIERSVP